MECRWLLGHTHFLTVSRWHIEQRLYCQRNISGVVQFKFVRNFCVCDLLEESFILVLSDFAFLTVPDCLETVSLASVEADRVGNELTEF